MFLPTKFIKYITHTKSSHIHLLFDRNQLNMNIYLVLILWISGKKRRIFCRFYGLGLYLSLPYLNRAVDVQAHCKMSFCLLRSQPPTFLDNLYYLVEKYTKSKFTVYNSVCFEKTRLVRRHWICRIFKQHGLWKEPYCKNIL